MLWINVIFFTILLILLKFWIDLIRGEAVFFPLPKNTIRKALKAASLSNKDVLYDLGSGDGRVLIIAAQEFGAKAVGIEKNPLLYWISKFKIKRKALDNKVKIIKGDIFKSDFSKATVVFVYLSKKLNRKLEPKLMRMKKGTKIISASHKFYKLKLLKKIKTGHFYTYIYEV